MKNKGFTLIELLAVIVILAIIALIATSIILVIIKDTKTDAIKRNAENYMKSIELAVADGHMVKGEKVLVSGTYDIIQNGKTIKLIEDANGNPIIEKDSQIELQVKYTGEGLKDGTVKLIDGKVRGVTNLITNEDYQVLIILGEVKIFKEVNPVILTTGREFNSKIKTLVLGEESALDTKDTIVKSIEFLGYGILPEGYTLEEFQKLKRVDISAGSDETIYAIYDGNSKVYIYAEDEIVFNQDSSWMFNKFTKVEEIKFGELIETKNVTKLEGMFSNCNVLISLDALNLNTSNVTIMQYMFSDCISLTELDLRKWDTKKVQNMIYMFENCKSLTSLDLSNFDTSEVKYIYSMFEGCSSLTTLDLSNFNTSQVTSMTSMFQNCSKLTSLDLSNFDTSNVTSMFGIFAGCKSLTSLDLSMWNTSNVTRMAHMFYECYNLEYLDLSNFDTSKVVSMDRMFSGQNVGAGIPIYMKLKKIIGIENFNTSNVTSMLCMFFNCNNLTNLDLSNWDTSQVTDMRSMFENTTNLKPIYIGEKWIINEGTSVSTMFNGSKTENADQLCELGSQEEWCIVN